MRNQKTPPKRCVFIVWKGYQRRVEVLAPLFNAKVKYIPHLFRHKQLRPLDYIYKMFVSIFFLIKYRPDYCIVQAPPHFAALPALLLRIPYMLDSYKGLYQSYWHKLPLFSLVMNRAQGVMVHNEEFLPLFKGMYPDTPYYVVPDPVRYIGSRVIRKANQILFLCSFDEDEPVDAIIRTIQQAPEITFVITADPFRLTEYQRAQLESCPNVRLTGYLSPDMYHILLCSSTAAVALTTMEATQQSGACEALSSNTPLIATRSKLSEKLFGRWATLVDNDAESIVAGIRSLRNESLNLEEERKQWNVRVAMGVSQVKDKLQFWLDSLHDDDLPGMARSSGF